MRVQKSLVCGVAGAVLAGSAALSLPLLTSSPADADMDGHVMTGPTGNKVEMVAPGNSTYVPNIARASAADRTKARQLLAGVNAFCRNHSAASIKSRWRPGTDSSPPTHYWNPGKRTKGLNPADPRAALVYDGRLDGVMFTGVPLRSFGSIPRGHSHIMTRPVEMLHVYCTKNLKDAFTPNRMLGVKGDLEGLRDRIRPNVMDLNERQLRAVRAKVRNFAGDKLQPVAPTGSSGGGGPDPVLEAMRTEIRRSLMVLAEAQLRSVHRLMQSY